jgi:uncharacterized oligopeptide transporter (OPT) family protein
LNVDVGLDKEQSVLIALVGTTVFGSAISMSGTVVGDYKNSLYIGNRPYHISKGNIMGVVPGAILGAAVAIFLSKLLADGSIDLLAPQANAFATFTIILAEGQGNWSALFMGFALGAFVEWATGMGTSFGLGMYLPTPMTFPMLIGGFGRDWWEKKKLAPKVEAIRLKEGSAASEKQRALMLLFTFMIAAGALTGEAFYGVEAAVLAVLDEQSIGAQSWWPAGRLIGFLLLNVILGFIIYLLFRSAGIIGVGSEDEGDDGGDSGGSGGSGGGSGASTVIDAELAD